MTNAYKSSPQVQGASIVLVGSFNPKILQPAWIAAQKLIRMEEAEAADIGIVRPELVSFSLDWAKIQVLQDKFVASTVKDARALRDLVLGIFGILAHTPINAVGLNSDFHFQVKTEEAWHAVGDRIAPKDLWKGILKRPGLKNVIIQGEREDGFAGSINVTVEPSSQIKPGIFISVNDHYEFRDLEPGEGCLRVLDLIEKQWGLSLERSKGIAYAVLGET